MPYDLFISYSRRDDENGRVSQLVERISRDFEFFAGRSLRVFFDRNDIQGILPDEAPKSHGLDSG